MGKTAVPIIEIDGYGLIGPGGGNDQINSVIAIDVLGQDPQAARRSHKLYGVPACRAEVEVNGIDGIFQVAFPDLYVGQIWAGIAVEISNGECLSWVGGLLGQLREICGGNCVEIAE
jgi:hypothetical protein